MFKRRYLNGLLLAGLFLPLASCTNSPSLTAITIAPTTMNFGAAFLNAQLTAIGTYSHPGHQPILRDITNQVTWQSSVVGCVKVTPTGLITSQNATCTNILVTASAPGYPGLVSSSMTVNVTITP